MKILFPNNSGISIIHPLGNLDLEEAARKDVPAGVPYLIVEDFNIPEDRAFRNAWEADFSNPHGYGIGAEAWLKELAEKAAEQEQT